MKYSVFPKVAVLFDQKKGRQKVEAKTLRSLPEADLSLLLLLLLPDNLNEVSPLESPLLAARYLNSQSFLSSLSSLSSSSSLSPSSINCCQALPVTVLLFLLLSAIVRLNAALLHYIVQVEIPDQHNSTSSRNYMFD